MSLRWTRASRYHQIAGPLYAVSRSRQDQRPGGWAYSAWYGESLTPGKRGTPFPALLGIFDTAQEARDACDHHAAERAAAGR